MIPSSEKARDASIMARLYMEQSLFEDLLEEIRLSCSKGKTHCRFHQPIAYKNILELLNLGYRVEWYDRENYFIIEWKKHKLFSIAIWRKYKARKLFKESMSEFRHHRSLNLLP